MINLRGRILIISLQRSIRCILVLICSLLLTVGAYTSPDSRGDPAISGFHVLRSLSFEANLGQWDSQVRFMCRGSGYSLFVAPAEAILAVQVPAVAAVEKEIEAAAKTANSTEEVNRGLEILRLKFIGANPQAAITGLKKSTVKINYFLGNDPARWRTDVPAYDRVKVEDIYPGIDIIYYSIGRQLKYDLIISPVADPGGIILQFEGADHITIDEGGNLVLYTANREIRQPKPYIYQDVDGIRREVPGRYVLKGNQVGFELSEYDTDETLVIDPEFPFLFFTYLGGSEGMPERGKGIAVDSYGHAYVTGYTHSPDFPHTIGQGFVTNGNCIFVSKISSDGAALLYSTYLGGSGEDKGKAIAVDQNRHAYITGDTKSRDFPTTDPSFQRENPGPLGTTAAFVAMLNNQGLPYYVTYLGGSWNDYGTGIAIDNGGNVYITGQTLSTDFPTAPSPCLPADCPFQRVQDGRGDAFITKMNPSGTALVYSTYLGGSYWDRAMAIALDQQGNAYITGSTNSSDFDTTPNTFQNALAGGNCPDSANNPHPCSDVFVTKLGPDGNNLVYSTYLGGDDSDRGLAIAVDNSNCAYVTGFTWSNNFDTTPGCYDNSLDGNNDAFVTKLNSAGNSLDYSTYLGGPLIVQSSGPDDTGYGIAVDTLGNAFVVGATSSSDFPITSDGENCWMVNTPCAQFCTGMPYAFVTKIDPTGSYLLYSSYLGGQLGGSAQEAAHAVALDIDDNAFITGYAGSSGLATVGAYATQLNGLSDAFVAKISSQQSMFSNIIPKVIGPRFVDIGVMPIYTFRVTNVSQEIGSEVWLKGFFHSGNVSFVEASEEYEAKGCCVKFALGTIKPGNSKEITLKVVPLDTDVIQLTARITGSNVRPYHVSFNTSVGVEPVEEERKLYFIWLVLFILALLIFILAWRFPRRRRKKSINNKTAS